MVVSVKCCQLQGALPPDPMTRSFASDPHRGHSFQTPIMALHFGSRFVCGPSFQISTLPMVTIIEH